MLKHLLFGGCKISIPIEQKEKLLNLCMKYELIYNDFRYDGKADRAYFVCTLFTAKRLNELCVSHGIRISVDSFFGLPSVLLNNRHRYGILIGTLLAVLVVVISRMFLWDIRVSGTSSMSEADIIDLLEEQGFCIGQLINRIDVDIVENKVLIASKDISWIAINLNGTVAFVEVREALQIQENDNVKSPANLVASKDGQIELAEVYEGDLLVTKGQLVRKGDILVSGVYDSMPWGYRYTRARGNVYARTVCTLHIEIPYEYREKTYSDEKIEEKTIVFFSKPIKLYRNTGFLGTTYDTIYKIEQLCFPDGTRLPLKCHTTTYLSYTYESLKRSPEQAIDIAYSELDAQISEIINDGATILKKEVVGTVNDDSYILTCTLTLLEDIAETVEFEVSELMEDK